MIHDAPSPRPDRHAHASRFTENLGIFRVDARHVIDGTRAALVAGMSSRAHLWVRLASIAVIAIAAAAPRADASRKGHDVTPHAATVRAFHADTRVASAVR
jgi:hypothetical protein